MVSLGEVRGQTPSLAIHQAMGSVPSPATPPPESVTLQVFCDRPICFRGRHCQAVERQTISIMKACELVGVSRRTIYNWIAAGKVEYVRTAGGSIRIFVDTLWRSPDGTIRDSSVARVSA